MEEREASEPIELPPEVWALVLRMWEDRYASWSGRVSLSRVCRTWRALVWANVSEMDASMLNPEFASAVISHVTRLETIASMQSLPFDSLPQEGWCPRHVGLDYRGSAGALGWLQTSANATRLAQFLDHPPSSTAVKHLEVREWIPRLDRLVAGLSNLTTLDLRFHRLDVDFLSAVVGSAPGSLRRLRIRVASAYSSGRAPVTSALERLPILAATLQSLTFCSEEPVHDPELQPTLARMTSLTRLKLKGLVPPDWLSLLAELPDSIRRLHISSPRTRVDPAACREIERRLAGYLSGRPLVRLTVIPCASPLGGGAQLRELGGCTDLESLKLASLDGSEGWIADLPSLRYLRASFTYSSAFSGQSFVGRLSGLRGLDLGDISSARCVDHVAIAAPELRELSLVVTDPALAVPSGISRLRRLVKLSVRIRYERKIPRGLTSTVFTSLVDHPCLHDLTLLCDDRGDASEVLDMWARWVVSGEPTPCALTRLTISAPADKHDLRYLARVCSSIPSLERLCVARHEEDGPADGLYPGSSVLSALRDGCPGRYIVPHPMRPWVFRFS